MLKLFSQGWFCADLVKTRRRLSHWPLPWEASLATRLVQCVYPITVKPNFRCITKFIQTDCFKTITKNGEFSPIEMFNLNLK